MKRLYFILLLLIVGCSKDDDFILGPEPPDSVVQDCITCYDRTINYNVPSWQLDFPLLHNKYYESTSGNHNWGPPIDFLVVDYDHDGYLDAVTGDSDYTAGFAGLVTRRYFKFFKGDALGNLTLDTSPEFYQKFVGPVFARKAFIGDYNKDGKPDLVFIDNGHDDQTGTSQERPGSYPIILMSNPEGLYDRVTYPEAWGTFHSGASADIDYDGDLDIVLPRYYTLINRGDGTFDIQPFLIETQDDPTTLEIADLDGDGILEWIYGSGSMYQPEGQYRHSSWIGNPSEGIKFIIPHVDNFGIFLAVLPYDIDGDGTLELIVNRASDQNHPKSHYAEWYIQILKYTSSGLIDITSSTIERNTRENTGDGWVHWFNLKDLDGDGKVELFSDDQITFVKWELENGFFKRTL